MPRMFVLLEGFQPKYVYEDVEGNRVDEKYLGTQDKKGNFVVKTNSFLEYFNCS